MSERDKYKYELKNGKKVVYVGITNSPDQRMQQHEKDKDFSHMNVVGRKTTEEAALKWEQERLETYRKNHGGENPKYNKTDDG